MTVRRLRKPQKQHDVERYTSLANVGLSRHKPEYKLNKSDAARGHEHSMQCRDRYLRTFTLYNASSISEQRQLQQSLQPRAQAAPAAADPTASQRGPASKFGVRNPNLDYVHLLRHRSGCLLPGTRILNLAFDIQSCILLLRSRAQYCTKDLSADVCTKLINTWPSPSLPVKVITCKEQRRDGLLGWLYLSVGIFRSYSFSQEQHASVTRRSRVIQARLCLANVRLNLVPGPHDL